MPARRPNSRRHIARLLALRARLPHEHGVLHGIRGDRRHPLSKNPLWARAGGKTTGGALPGGRLTRGVGAVVFLVLIGFGSRYFLVQRFNFAGQIERAARQEYIPKLERQLHTSIEVGSFETDWLGRVVVRDIVIGRNARLPLGALARARSATIGFDLVALALRRSAPLDAVQSVTLDQPQLSLRRNRRGQLNVLRLFPHRPGAKPLIWTGTIFIRGGRTYYYDEILRSTRGIPLEVDARGVNGTVTFNGKAPLQFNGVVDRAALPRENVESRDINSNGAYNIATKQAIVTTEVPPFPADIAAQYLFRKHEIIVTAGTIAGHVVLGIDGKRIAPRGEVTLQNIGGTIPSLREPLDGRPKAGRIVQLDRVTGPMRFVGTALETQGLSAHALDADWQVTGALSLGKVVPGQPIKPLFDATVSTQGVPLARLRPWVQRSLPAEVSTQPVKVTAQIAGSDRVVRASGALEAGATRLTSTQPRIHGSATTAHLRSTWVVDYVAGQPVRFAARAQVPLAQLSGNFALGAKRQDARGAVRDLQLTLRGATLDAPLEVTARTPSWQLGAERYGTTSGRDLRIDAFKPAATRRWQGAFSMVGATTSGLNRGAVSPAFARYVRQSGSVTARGNFADLGAPRPRVRADVALSSLSFAREALPVTLRERLGVQFDQTLQLSALRGQVAFENGEFALTNAQASSAFGPLRGAATRTRFGLEVPNFQLPARQLNALLRGQGLATSGDWRGRLQLSARPGGRDFDAQFALFAARAALGTARPDGHLATPQALLETPRLVGTARLGENGVWRANARLTLSQASVRGGRWGTTSLRLPTELSDTRLRDVSVTFAASPTGWAARLDGSRLAVPFQGHTLTLQSLALIAQNGSDTSRATTSRVDSDFANQFSDIQITRLSAKWGQSGQFDGTARVRGGEVWARLLAREVEADAVQRLLAITSRRSGQLTGRFNALVQIEPKKNPRFEVQMARGVAFVPTQNLRLPLSDVLARGEVQTGSTGALRLTDFSGWSEGAHLTASGTVNLRPRAGAAKAALPAGSGTLGFTGLRLSRVPLAREVRQTSAPDGVVSGQFKWQLGDEPQLEGKADLSGTTFAGVTLDKAQGDVLLARDPAGWRVRLERWNGTVEDAAFKGELEADTTQNFWRLRFSTPQIAARRLARIQARRTARGNDNSNPIAGTIPLEGDIFADIDINGTLRPTLGEANSPQNQPQGEVRPFWMPREGFATVKAPALTWRGRPLGALKADLSFEDNFARVRTLELAPETPPDAPSTSPRIVLTGNVPLLPNQPGLDATLRIGEAPLEWFFDGLRDGRDVLKSNGVTLTAVDQAVNAIDALPGGMRGRVALDATLQGSWSAPAIAVPRLTLRDGRAPLPQGGYSPPATLDTSFGVAGGALTFGTTQVKLEKTPAERENEEDDDPALLTIASGGSIDPKGDINLQADVVNANLSQLATWIPALKNSTGASAVRGTLSGFSLAVSGKTVDPVVVGSIQGENLTYSNYTIDRLRVSRFEVGGGTAQIAPGNLTIAKGAFQSAAAWGRVGWDWSKRGFYPDAPLELHFPLQTRDFGALSGVLLTSVSDVQAKEFQGSIDVGGTAAKPVLSGQVRVQGGQFRFSSPRTPFPVGVNDLNGSIRFEGNNRLVIDADDPLRGRLVRPAIVAADSKSTAKRNKADAKQKPATKTTSPKTMGVKEVAAKEATAEAAQNLGNSSVQLGGKWQLRGDVTLSDLSAVFSNPARGVGRQKFNLAFSLDDGSYSTSEFAGVRDVALGARWQTEASGVQRVRWMLAANGTKDAKRGKTLGSAYGVGNLRLAPNFATSFDALLRSQAEEFTNADDFKEFPVASRFALTALPDRRTQVVLNGLGWSITGAGNGELEGRVVLDAREATQQPSKAATLLQKIALAARDVGSAPSLRDQRQIDRAHPVSVFGAWNDSALSGDALLTRRDDGDDDTSQDEDSPPSDVGSLRIGGILTLQNTEIYGAPTGGETGLTRLSTLPPAPRFDVRLKLGRNVQFISSALRTQLEGDLVASGTPNNPLLAGTVETREGQVRFPNARARIETGRLIVAMGRDPVSDLLRTRVDVDVTARGEAGFSQVISTSSNNNTRPSYERYEITLRLRGPIIFGAENAENLQNLSIDVTSNPPLSQGEALNQLLGLSVRSDNSPGGFNAEQANQTYARAVLQLVSAPLFSGVERSVAQALGLDNVGFEYRFNEPLAVQFSKAIGDRVYVTYRRSFGSDSSYGSDRTPFELRIDYRLKGSLLLGLRLDEQNTRTLTLLKSWRF